MPDPKVTISIVPEVDTSKAVESVEKIIRALEQLKAALLEIKSGSVKGDPAVPVSLKYLKEVRHTLSALKQYIDQAPPGNPLVWIGDGKTPVKELPDYRYAVEALAETESLISQG